MRIYAWKSFRSCMGILYFLWIAVCALLLGLSFARPENMTLYGCVVGILTLCFMGFYATERRLLTMVTISPEEITSTLHGKLQCRVDPHAPVYYVRMMGREEKLVISNEPFLYNVRVSVLLHPFYRGANLKKQIVLPYNRETQSRLPLEQWHNMEEYDWTLYGSLYDSTPLLAKRFMNSYPFPERMLRFLTGMLLLLMPCAWALLCLQEQRGTVIGIFIATMIAEVCWDIAHVGHYRLKYARYTDYLTVSELRFSIRPENTSRQIAELFLKAPVYYAKCRLTDGSLHAANYIMVSNDKLAVRLAAARGMKPETVDFHKIIPICHCDKTVWMLDLSQCELIE